MDFNTSLSTFKTPSARWTAIATSASQKTRIIRQFFTHPQSIGAIAPSSQTLATEMANAALHYGAPDALVIEAGAGSGAITETLVKALPDNARFLACENNAQLADALAHRMPTIELRRNKIQHLPEWTSANNKTIVSSLPFRSLPANDVREIIRCFHGELCRHQDSILVQFSYGLRNPIPELAEDDNITCFHHNTVFRNLPPAKIWIYRRQAA